MNKDESKPGNLEKLNLNRTVSCDTISAQHFVRRNRACSASGVKCGALSGGSGSWGPPRGASDRSPGPGSGVSVSSLQKVKFGILLQVFGLVIS
jgi:hypothetical protein